MGGGVQGFMYAKVIIIQPGRPESMDMSQRGALEKYSLSSFGGFGWIGTSRLILVYL